MPEMPVKAAGWRIEPPVSVPVAAGARRAETAVDEPPDEPPGASGAVSFGLTGEDAAHTVHAPLPEDMRALLAACGIRAEDFGI